jgi:hypothetical protein
MARQASSSIKVKPSLRFDSRIPASLAVRAIELQAKTRLFRRQLALRQP